MSANPATPGGPNRGKGLALGPSSYILSSNGTGFVWVPQLSGAIYSVGINGSTGLTVTNSPLSSSGTINISLTHPTLSASGGNISGTINLGTGNFTLNSSGSGNFVSAVIGTLIVGTSATISTLNSVGVVTTDSTGLLYTNAHLPTGQFPALTGDVTNSAGSVSTTISSNVISNSKFRQSSAVSVVGNPSNTTANVTDITGSANQILSINSSGTVLGFNNITTLLDSIANVQGDILYRGASGWVALAPGLSGQVLSSGGGAANPSWITIVGNTNISTLTTNTSIDGTYQTVLVDTTAGNVTITVAAAGAGVSGRTHLIKKIDATSNLVNIVTAGNGNIDSSTLLVLDTQYQSRTIQASSSQWWITG